MLKYLITKIKSKAVAYFYKNAITVDKTVWGTNMMLVYGILGRTVPWTYWVSCVQVPYLIGGYVMPKVIDKVYRTFFEVPHIKKEMLELREIFDVMNMNMKKFTLDIKKTVDQCFKTETEEELEFLRGCLQVKITNLLTQNFEEKQETSKEDEEELQELVV